MRPSAGTAREQTRSCTSQRAPWPGQMAGPEHGGGPSLPEKSQDREKQNGCWEGSGTLPVKLNYNDDFPACAVYEPGIKNEADSQPIPGMPRGQ